MPKGKINTNRKGLTQRQITIKRQAREDRWVELYLGECKYNGILAAEMAGYAPKTAASASSRLLKNPRIRELIAEKRHAMEVAAKMTREEWVRRMEHLSRANVTQLMSWTDGKLNDDGVMVVEPGIKMKASDELTEEESWLISEIGIKKGKYGDSLNVKLTPKIDALRELGKALGYYPEKKGDGDTVNNLNINLHRGSDPMDLSALNSAEKAQLRALFAKMAPKVIGEGKGG